MLYGTGIDPFTEKPVQIAKEMRDRKMQRASIQFFKSDNGFTVREALLEAKRTDLIGDGCDCLIPANPPKEALEKRRHDARRAVGGDHYYTVANPAKGGKSDERGRSAEAHRLPAGKKEPAAEAG